MLNFAHGFPFFPTHLSHLYASLLHHVAMFPKMLSAKDMD